MPDNYAEGPDGTLLIANGINPVLRWDGLSPQAEKAGVEAPAAAAALAGSGLGGIVGTYWAFVRFVDEDGLLSNLSPVSAAFTATSAGGNVTGATNTAPIVITSVKHGLLTGATVGIDGVAGNVGANGTWLILVLDHDRFALIGSAGDGFYLGSGTWSAGAAEITYSNVAIPQQPRVARRQILRNTAGQTQTFYVDIDTDDLTSDTFTSTMLDTLLAAQEAAPLFDPNGDPLANRYGLPPDWKPILASHLGRMFAAGQGPYAEGCAAVAFGSPTVQGVGTEWYSNFAGRVFWTAASLTPIGILSVNAATQTLTLDSPYGGATDPFAAYSITPAPAERRIVYYSESGLPEAWPAINGLSLQEDGDEVTGLMAKGSFLYIMERSHIYRLTFANDPGTDGFVFLAANRGCVNNRCWVSVEEKTFMLDTLGVHSFLGGQQCMPLSQSIQDLFESEQGAFRINWAASRYFHAAHYPGQETVRWFVALGGCYVPRHALVYDYRRQRWWVEEFAFNVGSSALGWLNGRPKVYLGGPAGRVFALGVGSLDGPDATQGTVRGTVGTALVDGFIDPSARFPPSGVVGSPVSIVSGTGKGQQRIIASVSGPTVRLTQPWTIRPDSTSVYQIGGVQWLYRSGFYRFVIDEQESPRRIEVVFQPTPNPASLDALLYLDRAQTPVVWDATYTSADVNGFASTHNDPALTADLTKPIGFVQKRIDGRKDFYADGPRFVSWELSGVTNQDTVTVYQMTIDGVQ